MWTLARLQSLAGLFLFLLARPQKRMAFRSIRRSRRAPLSCVVTRPAGAASPRPPLLERRIDPRHFARRLVVNPLVLTEQVAGQRPAVKESLSTRLALVPLLAAATFVVLYDCRMVAVRAVDGASYGFGELSHLRRPPIALRNSNKATPPPQKRWFLHRCNLSRTAI